MYEVTVQVKKHAQALNNFITVTLFFLAHSMYAMVRSIHYTTVKNRERRFPSLLTPDNCGMKEIFKRPPGRAKQMGNGVK